MSIQLPEYDLPSTDFGRISGASDLFDVELAGQLITSEFFSEVTQGSALKIWNGSAWAIAQLKRFNGSSWVDANLKVSTSGGWI